MNRFIISTISAAQKRNRPFIVFSITFFGFLIALNSLQHYSQKRDFRSVSIPLFDPNGVSCYCKSNSTGEYYNFCYVDPQNKSNIGMRFDCAHVETLENLNILYNPGQLQSDIDYSKNSIVFVSGASDDQYNISHKSYLSIRKFYPNHKYILYGLGLSQNYINKLPISDSNFEFRQFNNFGYPNHVNTWHKYGFKALVQAEALRDFSNIWWIDSDIEMLKPEFTENFIAETTASPITAFLNTNHSIFAELHTDLLKYIPTRSAELLKDPLEVGSGLNFYSKTPETLEIMKWFVLCSLEEKCINPSDAQIYCDFNCFGFDQSVLNLLLFNEYQDYTKYYIDMETYWQRIENSS